MELVRQTLAGDPEAGRNLAERILCVPRILAARNGRLQGPLAWHDLEDVAQDSIAAIVRRLSDYRGEGTLETWFYGFAIREYWNALRRARRSMRPLTDITPAGEPAPEPPGPEPPAPGEGEGVESLLRHLTPRQAEIVRLRHVDQVESLPEIATLLGISTSSVKSHYYRALDTLRTVIQTRQSAGREDL